MRYVSSRYAAALGVLLATAAARAATYQWDSSTGGSFTNSTNWATGIVPGAADTAAFNLANTYTVTLATSVTTSLLDVNDGTVTFQLDGNTYTAGNLRMGRTIAQAGRLTLLNGTLATAPTVGDNPGSSASLTVGNDAILNAGTSQTHVGVNSIGTMTLTNGGVFTSTATVYLGSEMQGNGTILVSGGTSSLKAGSLRIGDSGVGTFEVSGGADVSVLSTNLGWGGPSSLTVSGAGSTFTTNGNFMSVGSGGTALLAVSNGAALSTGTMSVASYAGRSSSVIFSGAGTSVTTAHFNLGSVGNASMEITDGATLSTGSARLTNEGGRSTAVITGAGSTWNATDMYIGGIGPFNSPGGTGFLTVGPGATVDVDGLTMVRNTPVSTLTLAGGTFRTGDFDRQGVLLLNAGELHVRGAFTHGAAPAPLVIDGNVPAALPTLHLSGNAATTNVSSLVIGNNNQGALLLDSARSLSLGAGAISIGVSPFATGTLTATGANTRLITSGAVDVGGSAGITGGRGTLLLNDRASLSTGVLTLHPNGSITVDNAILSVGSFAPSGGSVHFLSGTISVSSNPTLNDAFLTALLGPAHVLGPGRALTIFGTSSITTNTTYQINGGSSFFSSTLVNAGTIVVSDGSLTTTGVFTNNAGRTIRVSNFGAWVATGGITNNGIIELDHNLNPLSGGVLSNAGTIRGHGTIANPLTNTATGAVRAASAGDHLLFTAASNTNNGSIHVLDGGAVEFSGGLANAAQVNLVDGLLQVQGALSNNAGGRISGRGKLFTGSLANAGQLALSIGLSEIIGPVTNNSGGKILITGGSTTTFFDNVTNNAGAEIAVAINSSAVFLKPVTGAGAITGSGVKYFADGTSTPSSLASAGSSVIEAAATLDTAFIREDSLTVYGQVNLAPGGANASKLHTLSIQGGQLNLANNALILQPTAATKAGVLAELQAHIATGRNGGTWDGDGITSSTILSTPQTTLALADNADLGLTTFRGLPVDALSLIVVQAAFGDATLDGKVDAFDLNKLAASWQQSNKFWSAGDFTGDGKVDAFDLNALAANWQVAAGGSLEAALTALGFAPALQTAAVPEPSSLAVLAGPVLLLLRGRRRSRTP